MTPSKGARILPPVANPRPKGKKRMTKAERLIVARTSGRIGGKIRAKRLTAKRRREIAQKAIRTRWNRHKEKA